MARGNMIYMMGSVISKPTIKIDKDGNFIVGRITLLTARRSGLNSRQQLAGEVRSDEQLIMSRNPYMIEHRIAELSEGDIICVKGTLSTREVMKKVRCPYCSEIASESMGVIVYIDPLSIMKIKEAGELEPEEVIKFLAKNTEFSNYAMCFGTLVREPRYSLDYEGATRREANIQVALNRKRQIIEDGPEKKTDYPYIRAFGKIAEETAKVLHTGSEIYIEGAIETREIQMTKVCSHCEKEFFVNGTAVELVPYSVEYISNIDTTVLQTQEELDNSSDELKGYMEQEIKDMSEEYNDEYSNEYSNESSDDNEYKASDYMDNYDDEDYDENY